MFDVGSALIGAVSGGGVTGLIWFLTRRDARRAERQAAIDGIVRAALALQTATRDIPIGTERIAGEIVGVFNELHVATLRLEPFLRARDKHTEWVNTYARMHLLFPEEDITREGAPGVIGARLMSWHSRRLDSRWFTAAVVEMARDDRLRRWRKAAGQSDT